MGQAEERIHDFDENLVQNHIEFMNEENAELEKQGQPRNGSYTFGGSGCFNGHIFIYSGGDTNYQVPEGLPCACGMTKAHYELCPTCGTNLLKPEPNV
jgi:hypothetical protein